MPEETTTPILDQVEIPKISALFSLNQLAWTAKDNAWHMQLTVRTMLPKTNRMYSSDLIFDEEPYKQRIESLERKLEEIRSEQTLFNEDTRLNGMDEIVAQIESIIKDREEKKTLCPNIRVLFTITAVNKWEVDKTTFTAIIDDKAAEALNQYKHYFPQYRIELTPQE